MHDNTTAMIEAVLAALGYPVEATRLDIPNGRAWQLDAGSARIYVTVVDDCFQVVAAVVRPHRDVEADFYRDLLRLNTAQLLGAAFGLFGDDIVISAERTTTGLDAVEVEDTLRRVSAYADFYDDLLAVEYGVTRCCDLPSPPVPLLAVTPRKR